MIEKFKNHIKMSARTYMLASIIFLSLVARIWYTIRGGSLVWWDESIYIGMGKYIATGGAIGIWETFRPPLFPLVYASLYHLHIPLALAGKILVILSSIGCIYLAYLLGEKIKKNAGIIASIFLSVTPIFFYFSRVPITDIMSTFFAMLSLYFFTNKKYLWTGFFVGVAFLLRFPQGLMLVPLMIAVIYEARDEKYLLWLKRIVTRGLLLAGGFFILVLPYLVSNYILYGDVFKPILQASSILSGYSYLYDLGTWYYAIQLWHTAPMLYFALLAPFAIFFTKKEDSKSYQTLVAVIVTGIIFMMYFFWQSHKELRYSIAFLPYVAICSGVGLMFFISHIQYKKVAVGLIVFGMAIFMYQALPTINYKDYNPFTRLYKEVAKLDGPYLSTTPQVVAVSDIKVAEVFESYETFHDAYTRRKNSVNGIIINSCDIFCSDRSVGKDCNADIAKIQKEIIAPFTKVYEEKETVSQCGFTIYKK